MWRLAFVVFLSVCPTYLTAQASTNPVSVAVFPNASPVVSLDESGRAAGIFPDMLRQLLRDLGYSPEFVPFPSFSNAYAAVRAGEVDILPAAAYSEERSQEVAFNNEPVMVAWGQLGALPNTDFQSLFDLRDKRIGMMRAGQNGRNFRRMMKDFDIPFQAVYFDSYAQITDALLAGDIVGGVYFNAWFRSESRVVPTSIVFSPTQAFLATAPGTNGTLFMALDQRLREAKADGESYYYAILNRWLSSEAEEVIPGWFWIAAAATVGLVVVLSGFLAVLRLQVQRATRGLEESRQRYQTVADFAHGWEFWSDGDGTLLYVSPQTERVTGYPPSAFLTDPDLARNIVVDEDRPVWDRHVRSVTHQLPGSLESIVFRIRRADGEVRWMEHRCTTIPSSVGGPPGHRGTNVDITERIAQQQQLEENLREKDLLLKEIHHRVKNNLQMVASMVSIQQRTVSDESTLRQLEAIANRVNAMGALHSTLYREDTFGRVNMYEYCRSIVGQLTTSIAVGRGITCSLDIEGIELDLEAALPCGLILNEALTNAFKHAFPNGSPGEIHVGLHREDSGYALQIADNGVGLSSPTESNTGNGGIGMDLITVLAQQLGGSATVSGSQGTTISVAFPAALSRASLVRSRQ